MGSCSFAAELGDHEGGWPHDGWLARTRNCGRYRECGGQTLRILNPGIVCMEHQSITILFVSFELLFVKQATIDYNGSGLNIASSQKPCLQCN